MGKGQDLVSIIIPAYNVENYIYRCVHSLMQQTYEKIEIIIIDDGSTDSTGEICNQLCEKDKRIIYVKKKNEGQGIARNFGIDIAKGEFITFADADDWCCAEYVEKMYSSMVKFHTDICVCGKYGVKLDREGNIISQKIIEQWMQPEERLEIQKNKDLIYRIKFSLWSKMFRRDLFVKNNIKQPGHKFENNTVIPMLVSKAEALSMVDEPLYYYWMNRESSTINNINSYADMIKCLKAVYTYFKQEGYWNEYEDSLYAFCRWNINHTLNRIGMIRADASLQNQLIEEFQDFMKASFPGKADWTDKNIVVWGSYNLKKTVKNIAPVKAIKHTFCYSSVISAVSRCGEVRRKEHANRWRENMVAQDIKKSFFGNTAVLEEADALFIDLLEERFGVCEIKESLYTKSDIFEEVVESEAAEVIWDDAYWTLWQEKCRKFMEAVLKKIDAGRIILVKYKLSEYYGRMGSKSLFHDYEQIREMNRWLERAYSFAEEQLKGCKIIEVNGDDLYFSDKEFEYGCHPYYLNSMIFDHVAQQIDRKVEGI